MNHFNTTIIKNLADILSLNNKYIPLNGYNIYIVMPLYTFSKSNILKEAYIKIDAEKMIFIEIDLNKENISEVSNIYLNNEFLNYTYYFYFQSSDFNHNILTANKLISVPECGFKELKSIYLESHIDIPKKLNDDCLNAIVPTKIIKLNADFEYYFYIQIPNNKLFVIKLKITNNIKHELPEFIKYFLCKLQSFIVKQINIVKKYGIDKQKEQEHYIELSNTKIDNKEEFIYFIMKLLYYSIYLHNKKTEPEPEQRPTQLIRAFAGGSINKNYQLYVFNNKYFIIYKNKKKYLKLSNIYINNKKLFIIINKNKYLIIH